MGEGVFASWVGGRPSSTGVNILKCQNALQSSVVAVFFSKVGDVLVLLLAFSGMLVTPGDSICSLSEPLLLSNIPNLSFEATSPSLLSSYFSLLFCFRCKGPVLCHLGEVVAETHGPGGHTALKNPLFIIDVSLHLGWG